MEKVEPIFVPEWLRNNGTSKARQTIPSLPNSDGRISSNSRNVSPKRVNGSNLRRASSDKTTSAYFRRSNTSDGYSHPRSNGSHGRSNIENDWNKDKEKVNSPHKDNGYSNLRRGYSHPSGNRFDNNLSHKSRFDKDLRRSYSARNGKRDETWFHKGSADVINSYKSTTKASFQRDFPSLGGEAREIKRISSPGLTNLITSLPSDSWSSALAEGPFAVEKDEVLLSPQQDSSNNNGPRVADILTLSPSRSNSSSPQLPTENKKFEEPGVKQSRQLVHMTSSTPKAVVPNAAEKLKPKVGQQMQMSSSLQSNHLIRGPFIKTDAAKVSGTGTHFVSKAEREGNNVELKSSPILERRPSAQAKSRNDFFNLMRKKSIETPQSFLSPSALDNDGDASSPESFVGDGLVDKKNELKIKGESAHVIEKSIKECENESSRFEAFSNSEEKEVAFMQSLGWEKTEKEDEDGLTKEEIDAFIKDLYEKIKLKPFSTSLQKLLLKYSSLLDNHTGSVINACVSSGSSLSESKLGA